MTAPGAQPVEPARGSERILYTGLLTLLLGLIAAGYGAFRGFVSLPDPSAFNLYVLAVAAGVASFFSPCAFPLLPGYLSFYYQLGAKPGELRRESAWGLALAAALGVISFDLLLGAGIAVLGAGLGSSLSISASEPSRFVLLFRGGVASILIILGVGQLLGWNLKPHFADALAYATRPQREPHRRATVSLFLYGLGYNAAGMGCTGPILAGLTALALVSGGFISAFSAFIIFALTMGGLMLLISGLVAASNRSIVSGLRAAAPRIRLASSVLLILVGAFTLFSVFSRDTFLRLLFPA